MKKVISSLLVMSMVLCASVAKADNVTVEQAKAIGAYYMAYQTGIEKLSPSDLTLSYRFENTDMDVASAYVFNVNGGGWIIIAGSSVVDPVIAFSEEGMLDMTTIPDNLNWWLSSYTDVVADIQRLDAENDYPDSEDFTKLTSNGLKGTKDQKIVLMATTWNQGGETNPSYNYYCPQDVTGQYSVTGCVATALAQICRYYRYPVQPTGVVSTTFVPDPSSPRQTVTLKLKLDTIQFDYSLMPNTLENRYGTIIASDAEVKQVAMLHYCLGLGVHMDYSPDGSGASMSSETTNAMYYKFKYQRGTLQMRSGTTDTAYINKFRRYLMNNDVIAMRGQSSTGSDAHAAGHAWVGCGYMVEDQKKYYMNWGWGSTGDGWYNLADNNMRISSMGYNFNVSQGCLFGVMPPEDSNIHHSNVSIQDVVDNTILGTAYPNPAELSVALPYTTENAADMQVFSVDGKLVATRRVQPGTGEVTLRVDALPKGVYVYRMNGKSGKFIVR